MRTLTQFQQNRRVIQDFTLTTLAGIPGQFARLAYIASLRDLSSGRYEHAGLAALYPHASIQQALQLCHEQIFERILESPLSSQEEDLRVCLAAMKAACLWLFLTGAATKPTASWCRKKCRIISRTFSAQIYGLFWKFWMRNALRRSEERRV